MKKYRKYMDGIGAPETLRQKLLELEAPAKRPIPWKRYGGLAAALALVCGLGGLGAWAARINGLEPPIPSYPAGYQQAEAVGVPDIAPEDPDAATGTGEKTLGWYETVSGSGAEAIVSHYILPYIEYGDAGGTAASQDWDVPKGAARRDLTQEEIIAFLGGEEAVDAHLDWGGYELTGWGAWYEDGSFWGAYLQGYQGPLDHFEFAVTADQLPPTCIIFPESVTQEVRGLTVTADGYNGPNGCDRRVSFMKDGYGYRFDLTSTDAEQAERMVSRLVCRIADEWLALWTMDTSLRTYTCEICGRTLLAKSSPHIHTYVDLGGSVSTEAYDPDEAADPSDGTPETDTCSVCGNSFPAGSIHNVGEAFVCFDCLAAVPAGSVHHYADGTNVCLLCSQIIPACTEHTHHMVDAGAAAATNTCPDCGVTYPAGEKHYHTADDAMCSGYPVPYVCPICGKSLPAGMEHSHAQDETEVCDLYNCNARYPAGTVHSHRFVVGDAINTCLICGETYPSGDEHSHEVCGLPLAPETAEPSHEVCGLPLAPETAEPSSGSHHGYEDHPN